ncbi:MAG: DNA mismatch repair protein MutS [Deltaproteobacteria bacterium]|nr:DNA mismatch repair protein MutS [Deltaproteobacteria bacterium]
MRQYLEIKERHKDAIVFFRMGDFYEMFFEDAKLSSRILNIALTSRDKAKKIPMCGIPFHAATNYISKLVNAGYKVALCEQIKDSTNPTALIQREVAKIITLGNLTEDEFLSSTDNNFIGAVIWDKKKCGFAYMDVSTGEFKLTELDSEEATLNEIKTIRPSELLLSDEDEKKIPSLFNIGINKKNITVLPSFDFDFSRSEDFLKTHFGINSLDGFGCGDSNAGVKAAGAILRYITETNRADLKHITKCIPYHPDDHMVLDSSTQKNLELIQNARTLTKEGTLLDLLDRTKTPMGTRLLTTWVNRPLIISSEINLRLQSVEEFIDKREERLKTSVILSDIYDLERLISRVAIGSAMPRDMISLKNSLKNIPNLIQSASLFSSKLIKDETDVLDPLEDLTSLIESTLKDSAPIHIRDGGFIREGFSPALDELRDIGDGGKEFIARLETKEREETGINSLKVGFNRVFGFYIEVTKAHCSKVPMHYIGKQTLVNSERFITPELKEWETKILGAEEKSKALEAEIFSRLREDALLYIERVQMTARSIALLDVLISLATVSEGRGYVKPIVNDGESINIIEGRHPVIESTIEDEFVPNDITLDKKDHLIIILTGPNMAGKSTFIRQAALIVLMAQIGSFVPAKNATIGVVDRIFSRVGASDDISKGQSTFMVEMNETANILNNATERSLLILDEIGRGTSTFDGLSIAWAVTEFIHDSARLRSRTLFATHYHELTDITLTKTGVKNYNMMVKEWDGKVHFLRKVAPGGASRSYGIQVAKLAGIPDPVINRADEILKNLEDGEFSATGEPVLAKHKSGVGDKTPQLNLPHLLGGGSENLEKLEPLRKELKNINPDEMTPIEALMVLNKIKKLSEEL